MVIVRLNDWNEFLTELQAHRPADRIVRLTLSVRYDARGIAYMTAAPWIWLAPGIAISVTVLSINFIGDGLRDAFDVRGGAARE